MTKKKVLFVTGNRADFGILSNLYTKIKKSKKIKSKILVCGNHFDKKYGNSYVEILNNNIKEIIKINVKLKKDKKKDILFFVSETIKKLTKTLINEKPNIVLLLGDRYEIFSAAITCLILNIPIAHIHGGEITHGAFDDSIRHSITKMSLLHFAATDRYRKRIIQLGENPKNVFNVGSLGVENLKKNKKIASNDLKRFKKIKFANKNLLIAYHPVTNQKDLGIKGFKNLLLSLKKLKHTNLIFTGSNPDPGGLKINQLCKSYVKKNKKNSIFIHNLGQNLFHMVLKKVDCIIGNSSSGIIEAPSSETLSINIGQRQEGRDFCKSIINVDENRRNIDKAINKIYKNDYFKIIKTQTKHYEKKNTSNKIIDVLEKFDTSAITIKKFFDINL